MRFPEVIECSPHQPGRSCKITRQQDHAQLEENGDLFIGYRLSRIIFLMTEAPNAAQKNYGGYLRDDIGRETEKQGGYHVLFPKSWFCHILSRTEIKPSGISFTLETFTMVWSGFSVLTSSMAM